MKPLKMTRAVRRQVHVLDLVFATSLTMGASEGSLPKKTKDVIQRIIKRTETLKEIVQGGPQFMLSKRERKRYLRNLDAMKGLISHYIYNDRLENDFFNAVLMLVEDCREAAGKSKNKRLQREWTMLNQSMYTLYCHMIEPDPEPVPVRDEAWAGYKYAVMGAALGKRLEKVFMG